MALNFVPRPAQQQFLAYTGGRMGVSAVPGSGKTFTLSLLAAQLVQRLMAESRMQEREVLVVTFTNSAAENFRSRIAGFLRDAHLLPGVGYRVRTLHGLAHDIVRERPGLVGLSEDFVIIDERTAEEIKRDLVRDYVRGNPDAFSPYIQPKYLQNLRGIERRLEEDAVDVANAVIRTVKDQRANLAKLTTDLAHQPGTWPLLEFGLQVYAGYQRALQIRGALDFDDLIVLSLTALEADGNFLARLQERWPYVLEDEAQDSSRLQESMLRLLTAQHANWVRVGDPNQSINTTFTSADVQFLRKFVDENPELAQDLPNSGRSCQAIIDLANRLNLWSRGHPVLTHELALTSPLIEPAPLGDPQPNPEPGSRGIYFYDRPLSRDKEVETIVTSLARWLPEHAEWTVAVLAPENSRSIKLAEALQLAKVPFDDTLLRTSTATRATAQALAHVLAFVARPHQAAELARVFGEVWWPRRGFPAAVAAEEGQDEFAEPVVAVAPADDVPEPVERFKRELRQLGTPEALLFPGEHDWLASLGWVDEVEGFRPMLEAFRQDAQRWARAVVLPVDELLLTLGNDLFVNAGDLALTHHLAVTLAKLAEDNPTWRLPQLAAELERIAQNRRRMIGFDEAGEGYTPKPGVVTVATMHGAKGLEWDRVYLMAVNSYSFPSGDDDAKYRGEPYWARDKLNLVAEAVAQTEQLRMGTLDDFALGEATRADRRAFAAERLRLLYVGITRARRELIVTYNTGYSEQEPAGPAVAFEALKGEALQG